MLGKQSTNFAVACLLAGTANAVLNSEDVNAYHDRLAEERREEGHGHFFNEAPPVYTPSKAALSQMHEPHPGIKIIVDKS